MPPRTPSKSSKPRTPTPMSVLVHVYAAVRARIESDDIAEAAEACGLTVKQIRTVLASPEAKAYMRTVDGKERARDLVLSASDLLWEHWRPDEARRAVAGKPAMECSYGTSSCPSIPTRMAWALRTPETERPAWWRAVFPGVAFSLSALADGGHAFTGRSLGAWDKDWMPEDLEGDDGTVRPALRDWRTGVPVVLGEGWDVVGDGPAWRSLHWTSPVGDLRIADGTWRMTQRWPRTWRVEGDWFDVSQYARDMLIAWRKA